MIELRGVRKRFGALQVLDGIDLAIAPGRVTALIGPNSAGKTTLIKSILGLTRIDAGSITLDGRPIDIDGEYRARVGYMPQIARFPENLTAADLFAMMRDLRRATTRDEELLGQLGLRPFLDKPLRVLSGGTRQKVNAALAFLFAPALLILDEPTAGLDPLASSVVKDKVLAERAKGRTFVLTSHVMSELEELADDIAFLVEGRIRFAGTLHDLKRLTRQLSLERAIAHVMERGVAA
ncbi:MAG: ABC transporter ATP-binding protein [Gemmatimonadaceae bacterium]